MVRDIRIEKGFVLLSLLPVTVQVVGITALLAAVADDSILTLTGSVLGLVWLKVTESQLQDKYGELRAQRELFITLGEWLDRADAEERVDEVISRALMAEGSIEGNDYKVAVTADSIANVVRKTASALLQAYLLLAVLHWWVSSAAA